VRHPPAQRVDKLPQVPDGALPLAIIAGRHPGNSSIVAASVTDDLAHVRALCCGIICRSCQRYALSFSGGVALTKPIRDSR
jgi:hypothetical protein